MIVTPNTSLIKVYDPNYKHITNSDIPIGVETPSYKPRTKLLAHTLCCEEFIPLKNNFKLKHNLYLLLNYGCIDLNAEYKVKLVGNSVHANLFSK